MEKETDAPREEEERQKTREIQVVQIQFSIMDISKHPKKG